MTGPPPAHVYIEQTVYTEHTVYAEQAIQEAEATVWSLT